MVDPTPASAVRPLRQAQERAASKGAPYCGLRFFNQKTSRDHAFDVDFRST
jgi:hypothetical protein